jgi:phage terminase large subunit-like protein
MDTPPRAPCVAGYDPYATADPGDWYDHETAESFAAFFPKHIKLTSAEWKGKPMNLFPWQDAFVRNLFGWKRADGTRRYRKALLYVPRKNAKTETAAGIVNAIMFKDNEPAAQMYSLATDVEQAKLVFTPTVRMIEQNPLMEKAVRVYVTYKTIQHHASNSTYRVLSGKLDGKHGLNPHLVIVDELHEFKERHRSLLEAMASAQGSRRQPLTIMMTTAGHAGPSLVNEEHEYASAVRDMTVHDHAYLPIIFEAHKDADWKDEKVWAMANPSYPTTPKRAFLVQQVEDAKHRPSLENTVRRLYLNQITDQQTRWLSMEDWNDCPDLAADDFTGPCYGGLDLASTTDMAAWVMYWPETHAVKATFWLPDGALEKPRTEHYRRWKEAGVLTVTPGDVIDYDFIEAQIVQDVEAHGVEKIGIDPWNARQIAIRLREVHGIDAVEFRQGFMTMNEPSKALEMMVIARTLKHGCNPIMTWCAQNAAVVTDPAGNIKPTKPTRTSAMKIDGIVALINAKGISMFEAVATSMYETTGISFG